MTAPIDPNGTQPSRLEHFPVSFFAAVMGLAGLTLGVHKVEESLGAAPIASTIALGASILAFVLIAGFYLAKAVRYPAAAAADWHHPVRLSFFPAISISLILIATAAQPSLPHPAIAVWWLGTVLQLVVTLAVISAWIGHRSFETLHLNPAWFIPAVGNTLVPVAGAAFGQIEISWLFFSIGMIFWIVLLALVFNRLIFHAPLPERLMPTLMILVAPPAIGFIAYFRLTGEIDAFGRVLYYGAAFFALLLLTQVNRLRALPFALSWWAYSFPLAALSVATFVYGNAIGSAPHQWMAFLLFGALVLVIANLVWLTARAIFANQICKPEN